MIGEIEYCRLEPVFYEHTDTNFTKFFAFLINGGKFISKSKKGSICYHQRNMGHNFMIFLNTFFTVHPGRPIFCKTD